VAGGKDGGEAERRPEMKRIYLSKTDSKIFGICGGIAEAYDIDATIIRLGAVFICVVTGVLPLLVTYLVGWFVIPERPPEQES
jgi:phage shock protein C